MSEEYLIRTVKRILVPKIESYLYSEKATEVYIEDEAAGEFLCIKQEGDTTINIIRLDFEEWPYLKEIIETFIKEIDTV